MEEESKDHSNKKPSQVFIITPEELAKLGILDSLTTKLKTNNKAKDQDSSVATTSATKTKPVFKNETEQLLLNIFKQKKVWNNSKDDNEVFKKPAGPSKFKDIKDTATITTLFETNVGEINTSSKTALVKDSLNATEIVSDTSNIPIILNKSATEFRKDNTLNNSNKTKKLKKINIISNTPGNFDRDELNKIVGQSNSTIIKTALVNNPKKSTFGRQKSSTSEIEFNINKLSTTYSTQNVLRKSETSVLKNDHTETNVSSQDLTKSTIVSQTIFKDLSKCSDKNKEDKQEFTTNISGEMDRSIPRKKKSKKEIVILDDIKISKQGELEIGVDLNNIPLIFGSNETPTSSHSSSEDLGKRELKRYSNNVRSQESETLEKTQVGIDTSIILDSILINNHLVNIPKSDLEDSLKEIISKVTEPTVNEKCDVATKLPDVLVSTSEKVEHSKKSIRELEESNLHQISDTSDSIKIVENSSEEQLNDSEFIYTNINTPSKKLSESNPISKKQHTSKNVSEIGGSTNLGSMLSSTINEDEANKTAENNLKEKLNDSESIRSNIDSTVVDVDISDQSNVSYISNDCKSIKLGENLDKTLVDLNARCRPEDVSETVVNDEAKNSYKVETEIEMNSTSKYTQTIIDIPKKRGRRKKVSQNQSIDLIQNINVSNTDPSNPVQIITVKTSNVSESVIDTETDEKVSDPEVKSCFESDENSTKIIIKQNIHQISPLHNTAQKELDPAKKMSDHEEDPIHKYQKRLEKQVTLKDDDAISNPSSEETLLSEEIKTSKKVSDDSIKIVGKEDPIHKDKKILEKQVTIKHDVDVAISNPSSKETLLSEEINTIEKVTDDSIKIIDKVDPIHKHHKRLEKQVKLKDDVISNTSSIDQKILEKQVSLKDATPKSSFDESLNEATKKTKKMSEDSINMVDKEDENRLLKQETLKDDNEDVTSKDDDDAPINTTKVTDLRRRYRTPWRNKRMEIDQKNKKIVQETTNILVEESEQPEIDGMDNQKTEVEEIKQGVVELRMEQESTTNLESTDQPFKKKRGRPRKNLSIGPSEDSINMVDKEDQNSLKQEILQDDTEDVTSNEDDDAPINKKKVTDLKRRYRIPWRNKRMEIDQKNKNVVQETANILVEESEQSEIDGMDNRKSEVSLTEHEEIKQGVELKMEQESQTNLESTDQPFKKKRGRPRKSLSIGPSEDSINMVDKEDQNSLKQEILQDDTEDVTSNEDDDAPINKKKVTDLKRRYRIPWRNKRMEIDQNNKNVVQETTNILVEESEEPEIDGMDNRKSEVSLTEHEEIKQGVELKMEQESQTNLESTDQPFKKKRGRPRKSLSIGPSEDSINMVYKEDQNSLKQEILQDDTEDVTSNEDDDAPINKKKVTDLKRRYRIPWRNKRMEIDQNNKNVVQETTNILVEESEEPEIDGMDNRKSEVSLTEHEEIKQGVELKMEQESQTNLESTDQPFKKKRGRPRKSLSIGPSEDSINMVYKEDQNSLKQEILQDDTEDVTSNEDDDAPINKKKVTDLKRRYRIPWRNKRMEIDQKNKNVVQETTNILVEESEQGVVELKVEQESQTNLESTDQPFKKKRGRPRKSLSIGTSIQNIESNIKESISTESDYSSTIENQGQHNDIHNFEDNTSTTTQSEETSILINTPSENTEPSSKRKRGRKSKSEKVENCALLPDKKIVAIEESNRGRKRAKINYLELEENKTFSEEIQNAFNTSVNEKNSTDITLNALDSVPKKKRGRPRKSETISYSEGKSEVAVVREGVESDTSETPPKIKSGTPLRSISVEPLVEEESDVLTNKESKSNLDVVDIQKERLDNSMIISDNSGLPLKNKVGRPRKNIPSVAVPPVSEKETKEGPGNINTVDEDINATPSTSFESPEPVIKKKRGRKSIGEQQSKNIPEEETVKPMKESKRGRKHVIIDYLQIESQLAEEIQPSKKTKQFSSNNDEFKPPKVKVETFTQESEMPIEKSKYTYTGQYTKLMSDVFSAAIKSDNTEAKPNINITQSGGRSKKNTENVFKVDEEGNVTCSSCKVKVDITEWNNHNETEHNNLAWRDGEPVVTLDHQATIEKLRHLHKKNKSLICLNCNNKYTKLKEFILHTEECLGIVVNGNVTCASCNKTMLRTNWSHHKLKHNNLSWRVGEHPLDLSNETFVIQTLNALYKAKKPLYCDKCEMVKKSVVGLLSHMSQCGDNVENAKISCEICGKRMLPVSLPTHIKFVHEAPKKVALESSYFEIDLDTSQKRRKAATKALAKMDELSSDKLEIFRHFVKQINFDDDKTLIMFLNQELEDSKILKCKIKGCEFSCEETSILLSHLSSCPLKPDQHYTCKTCFLIEPSEEDIINHIQLIHNIKIKQEADYVYNENDYKAGDDIIPEDELNIERKLKRKSNVKSSLIVEPKQKPLFVNEFSRWQKHPNNLFSHAFKFTFEFCEKNFCDEFLFGDLKCEESHWNLIDEIYLDKYLPPSEFSCDVVIQNVKRMCNIYNDEYNFKNYELFQIEQTDVNITIYCGGPVRCLAWLPTPHTSLNQTQILAVSTSKDFDEKYYHLENYTESTVIQFWNFGVLKNCQRQPEPKLEFCLGVDNGPIWHMEWCPSGCYNVNESDEWSRRGLLAVAGSSMPVHIYSIPFFKEEQRELFYTARPILKLQLVTDENNLKRKIFATKLSWSKVSGHSYIAVGYSDGTVAMYNLDATSSLLRFTDDLSLDVLLPYKIIKNHSHYISALSLVPIGDGNRLLLTSSFDKAIHIWDLQNDDKISIKKGKVLADGAWLTNWLSFVTACDESTAIGHAVAAVSSHREYLYDWCNLSFSTSTISSISASDWLNGIVHGNETGEINAFFPHQLIYEMGKLKRKNDYRFLTGFAKLIDKTVTPAERSAVEDKKRDIIKYTTRRTRSSNAETKDESEAYKWYEPFEYKGASEKYGVVFCDTKELYNEASVHAESEWPKSNLYPLVAINKISFNPNRQASLYYATGYQNGFVRLSYLKFLEKDQQIKVSESI